MVEPVETPPVVEPASRHRWSSLSRPAPVVEPVETPPVVEPVETLTGGRACRDPRPVVEPVETPHRWSSLSRPGPVVEPVETLHRWSSLSRPGSSPAGGRACRDPRADQAKDNTSISAMRLDTYATTGRRESVADPAPGAPDAHVLLVVLSLLGRHPATGRLLVSGILDQELVEQAAAAAAPVRFLVGSRPGRTSSCPRRARARTGSRRTRRTPASRRERGSARAARLGGRTAGPAVTSGAASGCSDTGSGAVAGMAGRIARPFHDLTRFLFGDGASGA